MRRCIRFDIALYPEEYNVMGMATKLDAMLSSSGLRREAFQPRFGAPELIRKELPFLPPGSADLGEIAPQHRRTRLWELDGHLHCSIIGTCLTSAEIRHIVVKLKLVTSSDATEHETHTLGVMLGSRQTEGAKFLQKALDRKHGAAIARYGKAKTPEAVLALWEESLKQGDIPGAYWAAISHPVTTEELVKRVFGDVHMLSHLVGAANRADIRRLKQLEQDNAELAAKIERQQRQLNEGFASRDVEIQRLNEMIIRRGRDENSAAAGEGESDAIAMLTSRLGQEAARRERVEQRLAELTALVKEKDSALQTARREIDAVQQELDLVEHHLSSFDRTAGETDALDLGGLCILYVGGRANQVPQLKALAERSGAQFMHHDGGIEHSPTLLPGLISRADRVFFPIDCISHDAMGTIKRACRTAGKTYAPLRTASLTGLLSALARMSDASRQVAAE